MPRPSRVDRKACAPNAPSATARKQSAAAIRKSKIDIQVLCHSKRSRGISKSRFGLVPKAFAPKFEINRSLLPASLREVQLLFQITLRADCLFRRVVLI